MQRHPIKLALLGLIVLSLAACSGSTAPPSATSTPPPVAPAAASPTQEQPSATPVATDTFTPAPTDTPTAQPSNTPQPTATSTKAPSPTAVPTRVPTKVPTPVPPPPTVASQYPLPPGKAGLIVRNYYGKDINFTIANELHIVPANGESFIVLDPGSYPWSANIPGKGEAHRTLTNMEAGQLYIINFAD